MEETSSRRKQSKPAKLKTEAVTHSLTTAPNESGEVETDNIERDFTNKLIKQEKSLEKCTKEKTAEIRAGTLIGPFAVKTEVDDSVELDNIIHIPDKTGRLHMFVVENETDRDWLHKIRFTKKDEMANCVLSLNGDNLQLITRKSVNSKQDLLAIFYTFRQKITQKLEKNNFTVVVKNHACNLCGTRFSNLQTLNAHTTNYCHNRKIKDEEEDMDDDDIDVDVDVDQPDCKKSRFSTNPMKWVVPLESGTSLNQLVPLGNWLTPKDSWTSTAISCTTTQNTACTPTQNTPCAPAQNAPCTPTQNTLLLPVAYVDGPGVTILGHPQTIIPVAIPKTMLMNPKPLIIESEWAKGIEINFTKGISTGEDGNFQLPLAMNPITKPEPPAIPAEIATTSTKCDKSSHKVARQTSKEGKPLDLTLKSPKENPKDVLKNKSPTNTKLSRQSPDSTEKTEEVASPDRRIFVCQACGIKFSSMHTLKGHQQYYCKANTKGGENDDVEKDFDADTNSNVCSTSGLHANPIDETPFSLHVNSPTTNNCSSPPFQKTVPIIHRDIVCAHCDYIAVNQSQLAQHNRSQHAQVQGYICELCGYKGYSLRGMKSHMKVHAEGNLSSKAADDLLKIHVKPLPVSNNPYANKQKRESEEIDEATLRQLMALGGLTAQALISPSMNLPFAIGSSIGQSQTPALLCRGCKTSYPDYLSYSVHKCSKNILPKPVKDSKEDEEDSSTEDCETSESDSQERHNCGYCSYRSPYKGNVKRHENLIHKTNE